jgi:hypothetical protein
MAKIFIEVIDHAKKKVAMALSGLFLILFLAQHFL